MLGKCGFYCGCCPSFLRGTCPGCLDAHGPGDCYTRDCVLGKGLSCCGACAEFPCEVILKGQRCTVLDKAWLQWKASEWGR